MRVTCSECNKRSEIQDPDSAALERHPGEGETVVGFTFECPHCGAQVWHETGTERRREPLPPPPVHWDEQAGAWVLDEPTVEEGATT